MKLISIKESKNPEKKFTATFILDNGNIKETSFGAKHMDDYTLTKNLDQRERYRNRHQKDLITKDPTRAGYLSYYILWGDSTKMDENVNEYRKKFNL